MFDFDEIVDSVIENVKKLFFPEEWIELDMKFSKSEIFTMLFLDKRKEITMTELVEYINSPMSTATGIVDRLVKNGYIKRDRGKTDRRIVILRLTEEGSRFVKNLKDIISRYLNIALESLTDEEKQFMAGAILKVVNNLQNKLEAIKPVDINKAEIKKIDIE
ncbi:MAG: MarR family winged helix-turn-helix transcriptional regulator [Caulobacteraceae bacterium]